MPRSRDCGATVPCGAITGMAEHRASDLPRVVAQKFGRHVWREWDALLADVRSDGVTWADWCFAPMAARYAIVSGGRALSQPSEVMWVSAMQAAVLWRPSKSVYRLEPELHDALVETPISGDIPSEVIRQLPEWCVYIEKTATIFGLKPAGFWAFLECDANDGRAELRLVLDCDDAPLLPITIHLGGTLREGVLRAAAEAMAQGMAIGTPFKTHTAETDKIADGLQPLVSLVLYLCTENPDVDGSMPAKARTVRTKKNRTPHLKGAQSVTVRRVGCEIAATIRAATSAHVRRAHWHTYWVGSEKAGTRRRELRWLSPMLVGGK